MQTVVIDTGAAATGWPPTRGPDAQTVSSVDSHGCSIPTPQSMADQGWFNNADISKLWSLLWRPPRSTLSCAYSFCCWRTAAPCVWLVGISTGRKHSFISHVSVHASFFLCPKSSRFLSQNWQKQKCCRDVSNQNNCGGISCFHGKGSTPTQKQFLGINRGSWCIFILPGFVLWAFATLCSDR